jgi:hypothetical protein
MTFFKNIFARGSMKKLVLFLVLFYSIILLPQTNETQALNPVQGYGINLLNSSGNSSIDNDISNIGFMNPAAISNFDLNFGTGVSYQFSSEMEEGYVAEIGVRRINDWMTQSVGAVYKMGEISFGLAFGQKYNGELYTGPIPITTVTEPDGTGEFWEALIQSRVQSYSAIVSYSFPEIFDGSSSLQVGFRYSLNHLNHINKIWDLTVDEGDNASSYSIGLQYSNKISESRNLKIGFAYEIEAEFEKVYEYTNDLIYIYDPDSTGRIPAVINTKYNLIGSVPDKFNLDVSVDLSESFKLNTMITGVLWEPDNDYIKNQLEFSASGIYQINEMFAPSFGFYYTDKNFDEDFFDINDKMNALYLIGGLKFNYDIFSADLAIADSHLFSGDYRKQTIAKLAIGVHL